MHNEIEAQLVRVGGTTGFYFKNLVTGQTMARGADIPVTAASVIKIPVLVEAFRRLAAGAVQPDAIFTVREEDKLPSCGALNYMHAGLEVTFMDLCTLMIILSDNTATNMLIKYLGMENINATLQALGAKDTKLNRLLFDSAASARGVENKITAREMGLLLEKLYHGEIVSAVASAQMLSILKNQRLNGKIPFLLPSQIAVAHKTGEDDGITHDVGIVYAAQPFIICFCGQGVQAPVLERTMQDITRMLFDLVQQSI